MSVIRHPSSNKLQKIAWAKFDRLRKHHEAAANQMWLGALVANFTDDELALLSNYLCPNDYALLKKAGRKVAMPKSVRRIING